MRISNCLILDHNLEELLKSISELKSLEEFIIDVSRNPLSDRAAEITRDLLGKKKFKLLNLDFYDTDITGIGYQDIIDCYKLCTDEKITKYISLDFNNKEDAVYFILFLTKYFNLKNSF